MRHQICTEITIEATPEDVWNVLTDLDSYDEWNLFITSSAGRVVVGEQLTNRMQPPGGKAMTFRPTVTVADHAKTFEWLGRLFVPGLFDGRHRFDLTEVAPGKTRLVHSEQFSGLLVRLAKKSLDTSTVQGFEAMNETLKKRVENAPAEARKAVSTCAHPPAQ